MSSESIAKGPSIAGLKPDLCVSVGVTGHRLVRMPGVDLEAMRATVVDLLSRVRQAADGVAAQHATHFASRATKMRLVTALADGADTIAAEAALSAGWRLDACLPFAREEYVLDFADAGTSDRFGLLLERASATFALSGVRADADAAYEAVGRVVLDQSDILLALCFQVVTKEFPPRDTASRSQRAHSPAA